MVNSILVSNGGADGGGEGAANACISTLTWGATTTSTASAVDRWTVDIDIKLSDVLCAIKLSVYTTRASTSTLPDWTLSCTSSSLALAKTASLLRKALASKSETEPASSNDDDTVHK